MRTVEQGITPMVQPVPQTSFQIIAQLKSLLNERYHAVNAYPFAISAHAKFELIALVRWELDGAAIAPTEQLRVKLILRQHNRLLQLTPKRPLKRAATYTEKIKGLMEECRNYLGWREQA